MPVSSAQPFNKRADELWIALPDGGRALGGSDDAFLKASGFDIAERASRVDDFLLKDGPDFADIGLRTWIRKSDDGLFDIDDGDMDVAIVGRDVLREFNAARRREGKAKLKEVLDLNMASCVLALAVREADNITTLEQLGGGAIASKYVDATSHFLKEKGIANVDLRYRKGKLESKLRQSPSLLAISDIVESGNSLVANGQIPLGMDPVLWDSVKSGALRFADIAPSTLSKIPGVITISSLVMVRTDEALSAKKEKAIENLALHFEAAAKASGRKPKLKIRITPPPTRVSPDAYAGGFPGHLGARW